MPGTWWHLLPNLVEALYKSSIPKSNQDVRWVIAALASHDAESGVTSLWSPTQTPHGVRDGLANLTGSSPHGQGHETTWAQIATDVLQLALEDITVKHGDTAVVPRGIGTSGSRSPAVGGSSVHNNARSVSEKARRVAAYLLEAAEPDHRHKLSKR